MSRRWATALAAVALATATAQADTVEDFYKDKQINLIVGYGTISGRNTCWIIYPKCQD